MRIFSVGFDSGISGRLPTVFLICTVKLQNVPQLLSLILNGMSLAVFLAPRPLLPQDGADLIKVLYLRVREVAITLLK
jgi:hypothetical protein